MPRLLIAIIVMICGYYALWYKASLQIQASFLICMDENGGLLIKNNGKATVPAVVAEEARANAHALFECMDRRNGFIARLFFDKNKVNLNVTYSNTLKSTTTSLTFANSPLFHTGAQITGFIMLAGLHALITVLPIKLAANFTNGTNTSLLACALAAVVAPLLSVLVFRLSPGGFPSFVLAFLTGITAYVAILRIPGRSIIGFSILAGALQLAVFGGLLFFGVSIGKMFMP